MTSRPERYEDVVGPARRAFGQSLAVFRKVAQQTQTAIKRCDENTDAIAAKIDETCPLREQNLRTG